MKHTDYTKTKQLLQQQGNSYTELKHLNGWITITLTKTNQKLDFNDKGERVL